MRATRLAALLALGAVAVFLLTRERREAEEEPAPAPRPQEGASRAKAHFMREFVAALSATPTNLMPRRDYAPLLKEGSSLRCADCHAGKGYDETPPPPLGEDALGRYRLDREGFMVPLMEKWVARLNKRHKDRLVKEVTCEDCHARDPRDGFAALKQVAPLMSSFVRALTEPPRNRDPAKAWKPLLKPGEEVSCATCHGDAKLSWTDDARPPSEKSPFMIRLMERWVKELNRTAKDRLVRAVGCIDCHEVDPRK